MTNSVAGVTADKIIDLIHSVDPAYRVGNAAFIINDSTLEAVRKLKDCDVNYLWQMGNYQAGVRSTKTWKTLRQRRRRSCLVTYLTSKSTR